MNRFLVLMALLLAFVLIPACKTREEVPVPSTPLAVKKTEAPAPPKVVTETAPPRVEQPVEATPVGDFDPSTYQMEDVYFDFDKSDLREDTRAALDRYAEILKKHGNVKILVEGHCDERGTEEYNMALGERRANRVVEYLVSSGIAADRISSISYGKMRPKAQGSDEGAWAQNRRAHFALSR